MEIMVKSKTSVGYQIIYHDVKKVEQCDIDGKTYIRLILNDDTVKHYPRSDWLFYQPCWRRIIVFEG